MHYEHGWYEYKAGTNSGATAPHAAATGKMHVATSLSGHTDADSLLQIIDGTTVVWETKLDVSLVGIHFSFPVWVPATPGAAISGKIASSSADCHVHICGYTIA
jgi:hypothetical protein